MSHVHRIYSRIDGVLVPTGYEVTSLNDSPLESIVKSCNDLAKAAAKTSSHATFAYKIDNKLEHYISSAFFKWPNFDNEEQPRKGKKKAAEQT